MGFLTLTRSSSRTPAQQHIHTRSHHQSWASWLWLEVLVELQHNNTSIHTHVISHGLLRGVEIRVVAATALDVEEPASDAPDQQRVVDAELHHRIQLCPPLLQQVVQLIAKGKPCYRHCYNLSVLHTWCNCTWPEQVSNNNNAQALNIYKLFTNTYCQYLTHTTWMHTHTHAHTRTHAHTHTPVAYQGNETEDFLFFLNNKKLK